MKRAIQSVKLCAWFYFSLLSPALLHAQGTAKRQPPKQVKLTSPVPKDIQPLDIGDKLPDLLINNIVNYSTTGKTSTSSFQNKLLLLDFMATNCISCIEALPRLDSLQKAFGDQLQILLVTYENPEKVKAFLLKNRIGKQINLAFVTQDSLLKKHFPHQSISHVAWVNKGKVIAITGTQYVKAKNLNTIFEGKPVNWLVKRDVTDFDYNTPLLSLNKNKEGSFKPSQTYYSTISNSIPGVSERFATQVDSINHIVRTYMVNSPIVDLYLRSWDMPAFPVSRITLEVKDKNRFIYNRDLDYWNVWVIQNTFTYEATFPISIAETARGEKIRNDLDFYFGLEGRMETRKTKCYVLSRSTAKAKVEPIPAKTFHETFDDADSMLKSISISNLVDRLNNKLYGSPVLDESNFGQEMYLQLNEKIIGNMVELNNALVKYGLEFKQEMRTVEMFVLTERPHANIASSKNQE